jgi:Glycosyltransferase family 92
VGAPALAPQDSPGHPLAHRLQYWRERLAQERRDRRQAREGAPSARSRRAILTIVHNEAVFFPIWLRYYSRFFDPDDIYVLDNETTDGSTGRAGFVRVPVEHDTVDHVWMLSTIQELQHELMERYDVVMVTDVDEIVSPVPELGTLAEYLDHFNDEYVNCLGYEVLHMRHREPALDLDRPILGQRRFWFANDAYDKPAVASVPMEWIPGLHDRTDLQTRMDPDLRLIHLHRMDYDICLERHRVRRRKAWADEDEERAWAVHNRIVDPAEFEDWFYRQNVFKGFPPKPEDIRPNWWGVV